MTFHIESAITIDLPATSWLTWYLFTPFFDLLDSESSLIQHYITMIMMWNSSTTVLLLGLLSLPSITHVQALQGSARPSSPSVPADCHDAHPRRTFLASITAGMTAALIPSDGIASSLMNNRVWAMDEPSTTQPSYAFETRDRKGNKDAVIREDYWYMTGKLPPRLLTNSLQKVDDPQWNAFGSCTTSENGSNSCTYVSLNQRIPAYSKYGSSIAYGAREYQQLGKLLQQLASSPQNNGLRQEALAMVQSTGTTPPAVVDAEVKLVLLATALTTSPNFPQPGKELLVARFYANEVRYAHRTIAQALSSSSSSNNDMNLAWQAWLFGKDSWNSYFQVVNRSISPKVGDKFVPIE